MTFNKTSVTLLCSYETWKLYITKNILILRGKASVGAPGHLSQSELCQIECHGFANVFVWFHRENLNEIYIAVLCLFYHVYVDTHTHTRIHNVVVWMNWLGVLRGSSVVVLFTEFVEETALNIAAVVLSVAGSSQLHLLRHVHCVSPVVFM